MRIGVVGCGLNSDYHLRFAKAYPGIKICGVFDKDERRARDCMTRYRLRKVYASMTQLVETQRPDVLHIVTPPQTHYAVAREAIALGCNVLVEKPLALNLHDAKDLYDLAEKAGVKLCTMHNHFFDPCMIKARNLIRDGRAGRIIHIESYYGLNTRIDAFRKYPAPNALPWLYLLPGGAFHDFMPHPLYVMLPYLGKPREVQVMERSFGELPQSISDELRISLHGEHCLGSVVFSFAARPFLHYLRIFGTRMMIHVDFNTMTTTSHPVSSLPKAAQKVLYNFGEGAQLLAGTVSNVWNVGRGKLKSYHGMQTLMHQFYDSVKGKAELPVSRDEALTVIETMDEIWKQVRHSRLSFKPIIPNHDGNRPEVHHPKVLVTGATGFLGTRLIERLVQNGASVRALARKLSNIEKLKRLDVEIFFGDVADMESLKPAFDGVDCVVHAAADTSGNEAESRQSTIRGTGNVLELCERLQIKKLVYISSCGVYDVTHCKTGQSIVEESPLERYPQKRGHYSHAKLEAETLLCEAQRTHNLPAVCLRPGTIYGPGGELFTPMMGFALGRKVFMILGNGTSVLPLVYIDNLAEAIIAAIWDESSTGKTYNVVDNDAPTKKQYVESLLKRLYPNSYYFYVPLGLLHAVVLAQELLFKMMGRKPFLTRYRLISSQKKVFYDASKIRKDLKWNPSVAVEEAFNRIIEHEKAKSC